MGIARQAAKALFTGADRLLPSPPGPRLLIYHQVGAGLDRQTGVSIDDFVWQLDWLVSNREVVDLDAALERWFEPRSERLVVIAFDDGYADTYTTAFPFLRERGLHFSLYLATAGVGAEGHLTWDDIGEMVSSGLLTLGAHTHSHLDLRTASETEVVDELETSNRLIYDKAGVHPSHFAYPWGYWSITADRVVRASYESAVLGSRPAWRAHPFDRHLIYRFPVQASDGRRWFSARLQGGLLVEESMRRRLRGYSGP